MRLTTITQPATVTTSTTTVPFSTVLIVGLLTALVAVVGRWFIRRSGLGSRTLTLPSNIDQSLTVDMKGESRLTLFLQYPAQALSSYGGAQPQWVSCLVDGKLVDIPPGSNQDTIGLTVTLTKPAGTIVATHMDAGASPILAGRQNTVTTINYSNAGIPTGVPVQSTSGNSAWFLLPRR